MGRGDEDLRNACFLKPLGNELLTRANSAPAATPVGRQKDDWLLAVRIRAR
jgi:hypothetical protein